MPNLATRFWADVRFVFRHSGTLLRASESTTSQGTSTPRTFSASSRSRNPIKKHGRPPPTRSLATRTATACATHYRTWQEEALQDMMLSWPQHQSFRVSSPEDNISVREESLRAASPLRSPPSDHSRPRFDWRLRASSRAPALRNGHKISRDGKETQSHVKRVIPQHPEIQSGERFHDEVKAYEDRWVFLSYLRPLQNPPYPFLLDFYPCWGSSKPKRKRRREKDSQSGPSRDCASKVTASQGCWHSG
jgi:hypothetical protein